MILPSWYQLIYFQLSFEKKVVFQLSAAQVLVGAIAKVRRQNAVIRLDVVELLIGDTQETLVAHGQADGRQGPFRSRT